MKTTTNRNFLYSIGIGSFSNIGKTFSPTPLGKNNLYLGVEIGARCQLSCKHCIYAQELPNASSPNPDVLNRVQQSVNKGLRPDWVTFPGREPTLFPDDLSKMAGLFKSPGRRIILMTNAMNLDDDLASRLAESLDSFDISIDGDEYGHDWMRGNGMFKRLFSRIAYLNEHCAPHIGLIATAVHGNLPDGTPQINEIRKLAHRLNSEFGDSAKISLSVSLYYGNPSDPFLLDREDLKCLAEALLASGFQSRLLLSANYSHLWPMLANDLGWQDKKIFYDASMGIPFVEEGHLRILLFNLSKDEQLHVRIANDGDIYLGCNHLTLGNSAKRFRLGNVLEDDLCAVVEDLRTGRSEMIRRLSNIPDECTGCNCMDICQGGDQLSGIYFNGKAQDPYCQQLKIH